MTNNRIINFNEACAYLGFKKSRLYNEVFLKRIPHYKCGKTLKFSTADLDVWLESKKVEVTNV